VADDPYDDMDRKLHKEIGKGLGKVVRGVKKGGGAVGTGARAAAAAYRRGQSNLDSAKDSMADAKDSAKDKIQIVKDKAADAKDSVKSNTPTVNVNTEKGHKYHFPHWLFLLMLFVNFVQYWYPPMVGIESIPNNLMWGMWTIVGIMTYFTLKDDKFRGGLALTCLAMAWLTTFIPVYLNKYLGSWVTDSIGLELFKAGLGLLAVVPLFFFFVPRATNKSEIKGPMLAWISFWIFVYMLLFVQTTLGNYAITDTYDARVGADAVIELLQTTLRTIMDQFQRGGAELYQNLKNRTIGPEFLGLVEDNEEAEKLGVYIEDLDSFYDTYTKNDDLAFFAVLSGKTFVGDLYVQNRCYLKNGLGWQEGNEEYLPGVMKPDYPVKLSDYESYDLRCQFDSINETEKEYK